MLVLRNYCCFHSCNLREGLTMLTERSAFLGGQAYTDAHSSLHRFFHL